MRTSPNQLVILLAGTFFIGWVHARHHIRTETRRHSGVSRLILPNVQINATISSPEDSSQRLVFSHFMIGVLSNRNRPTDYDDDMVRAKASGIDAFALNIGIDPYTDTQLEYAYTSAANNGMKVFLSFDFNWYSAGQTSDIAAKIAHYASLPAQLMVNNKIFVSSFAGDGLDVTALRTAVGKDIYFAPNFHPEKSNFGSLDAALNWMGWENNGDNKAPSKGKTITINDGDRSYMSSLDGKAYIAPVSPWFSTHFGAEVPYSKNWVFPGDLLWYQRWVEILVLKPHFVEIITWNDYGESHYIGPLSSPHTDDGGSKWVNDMPHGGWLEMAKPFIAAYKAGSSAVDSFITQDQLIYWYRITSKNLDCDATDTTMGRASNDSGNYFQGRPNGYKTMTDDVFVVPLLTSPGKVTVTSGSTKYTFNAPAGASAFSVPSSVGVQHFSLSRKGKRVMSATSLKVIQNTCPCGLYNFNAYVGTVPEGERDELQSDGLAAFTKGLKVACDAKPSLPATPPRTTASTSTSVIQGALVTVV